MTAKSCATVRCRLAGWRIVMPLLAAYCLACGDDRAAQESAIGGAGITVGPPSAGATATAGSGWGQAGAPAAAPAAGAGGTVSQPTAGTSGQPAAEAGSGGVVAKVDAGTPDGGAAGTGASGQDGGAAGSGGTGGTGGSAGAYAPCPASGEVCRILPLGDSITFGIGYDGGYRVELFRKALADGKNITFTGSLSNGPAMVDGEPFPKNNEGHSGWKIAQLPPLIPKPAFQPQPHVVLLMIGTNDIAQNDDLANAPKRLGSLIDLLAMNARDALIVVATVIPLSFGGDGVPAYNTAISAVVEARIASGKHVLLVDMFTGFPTSELGDGVHPNQSGYERMAGVWYEAIGSMLH